MRKIKSKKASRKKITKKIVKTRVKRKNPEANITNTYKNQIVWFKGKPVKIVRVTPRGVEIFKDGSIIGAGFKAISLEPPITEKSLSNAVSTGMVKLNEPLYNKYKIYEYQIPIKIFPEGGKIYITNVTKLNGYKDEIPNNYRFIIDFVTNYGEDFLPPIKTPVGIRYSSEGETLKAALAMIRAKTPKFEILESKLKDFKKGIEFIKQNDY